MPNTPARLYVRDVIDIDGESEVRVVGEIMSGNVREGMQACVSLGSMLSVVATIKRVESRRGDEISISLDTPDKETREFWKELCLPGDRIGIIENEENG